MPPIHRETIRACIRVIAACETLEQARTQLGRMLGTFDKLRIQGHSADKALAEATRRIELCPPPPPPRLAPAPAVHGAGTSLGRALRDALRQIEQLPVPPPPVPPPGPADSRPIRRREPTAP
jgi:hypothetical protein